MAGETLKTEAVCLSISPWSRTSHVVAWLTPAGRVVTLARGATRPKSFFLGQYDLNYTCEIVYYARAKGDIHALRECFPVSFRDALREDHTLLAVAGYFRTLASRFAPPGEESSAWFAWLTDALDALAHDGLSLDLVLRAELRALDLMGLALSFEGADDALFLAGERRLPVAKETQGYLQRLATQKNAPKTDEISSEALDAARVIGVYYSFHVDGVTDVRRTVFNMMGHKLKRKER